MIKIKIDLFCHFAIFDPEGFLLKLAGNLISGSHFPTSSEQISDVKQKPSWARFQGVDFGSFQ